MISKKRARLTSLACRQGSCPCRPDANDDNDDDNNHNLWIVCVRLWIGILALAGLGSSLRPAGSAWHAS